MVFLIVRHKNDDINVNIILLPLCLIEEITNEFDYQVELYFNKVMLPTTDYTLPNEY